jgi:uracil-DNA glycosylase family 4
MYPVCMKVNYSKALKNLRQSSVSDFSYSLFENVGWIYPLEKLSKISSTQSEKVTVLNELKDFSDKQFIESLSKEISRHALEQRFCLHQDNLNKLRLRSKVKIMFVNDVLIDKELGSQEEDLEHATNEFVPELKTAFSTEVSELFARMIKAMKLSATDFVISGTKVKKQDEESDYLSFLHREIDYLRPQMIITLGAVATQSLLESKERLAKVHGQIFHKKIQSRNDKLPFEIKIMPLFHPELLLINPNMKKTAWFDMQKAMKEVGTADS